MSKVDLGDFEIRSGNDAANGEFEIIDTTTGQRKSFDDVELVSHDHSGETITPTTVTASTLTDANDNGAWETLREAGYEVGNPVTSLTDFYGVDGSTASSTYGLIASSTALWRLQWDKLWPSSVTVEAHLFANVDPSTDQIDVRLQNLTDSETVVSQTGITTAGNISLGPVTYSPTTTGSVIRLGIQARNADGATSVTLSDPGVVFTPRI